MNSFAFLFMIMAKEIYLDAGATTRIDPKVVEVMMKHLNQNYGNASSSHSVGQKAKSALNNSRKIIAKAIKARPEEIIFTSGGTESNNFAIKSIAFTNKNSGKKGNHIITTKIEHDCVLNSCKWLKEQGFKVTYLDVDKEGFVKPEDLENAITNKTILVSIIHGNNEIGTIQDLKVLGDICKKHDVYFHTDACQSFTKTKLNAKDFNIDLMTLNAHKIHGPKGVGCLFVKKGTNIKPWQHGGGHEFGLRSGTDNVPAIVGFAEAVKLGMKKQHLVYMQSLRNKMIKELLSIPNTKLNGPTKRRLCNNINICFKDIDASVLGLKLNNKGIASSLASACSTNTDKPSHVLKAIGLSDEDANSSLRFTISRFTQLEELEYAISIIKKTVASWRKGLFAGKVIE